MADPQFWQRSVGQAAKAMTGSGLVCRRAMPQKHEHLLHSDECCGVSLAVAVYGHRWYHGFDSEVQCHVGIIVHARV